MVSAILGEIFFYGLEISNPCCNESVHDGHFCLRKDIFSNQEKYTDEAKKLTNSGYSL